MAGTIGNINSLRHGQKSHRARTLTIPSLGPRFKHCHSQGLRWRTALETAVMAARGNLTPADQELINRAGTAESLRLRVACELRAHPDLPTETVLKCADAMLRYGQERSGQLAKLKLAGVSLGNGSGGVPWATLDGYGESAEPALPSGPPSPTGPQEGSGVPLDASEVTP